MAKNVWQDDAFVYSGDTLHYRVRMNGRKIYEGVATAEDFPIRIYLNRIAQDYLESTFPETMGVTQDKGASAVFTLNEMTYSGGSWVEGNTLYQETYIDAYEGVYEGCMAQPINGHADARQRLFYTTYSVTGGTFDIVEYEPVPPVPPYADNYLTFEIISGGTIGWTTLSEGNEGELLYYSKDNGATWTSIAGEMAEFPSYLGNSFEVEAGDVVLLKGYRAETSGMTTFKGGTAYFNAYGNIMSLFNGDDFYGAEINNYFYCNSLFAVTNLVDASNIVLPSETRTYCYRSMFSACRSMTAAPALPATALTSGCYYQMFSSCTALTESPILRADYVPQNAYMQMFDGCSSLNKVTCLATEIYEQGLTIATDSWLNGVAANGTFIKSADMDTWETGNSGIPTGWTVADA